MALFTSKNADNIETLTTKLAAAKQRVVDAEGEMSAVLLEAAMSDDPDAVMKPLRDRLDTAERIVTVLAGALEQANQAEQQRLAEARSAAERSRHKSIAINIGKITTAAEAWTSAAEDLHRAWSVLHRAADKAWDSCNTVERESFGGLNPDRLLQRCDAQLELTAAASARADNPTDLAPKRAPGFPAVVLRERPDLIPLVEFFSRSQRYASAIFNGEIARPLTLAEKNALPPPPVTVATPAEALATLLGHRVVSQEEFDAIVSERTPSRRRAAAAWERADRARHDIEVPTTPEAKAVLAGKLKKLFTDDEGSEL